MAGTVIDMGADKGRTVHVAARTETVMIPHQYPGDSEPVPPSAEAAEFTGESTDASFIGDEGEGDPENDDIEYETGYADIDLTLDEDPDTSLVGSLSLHLLSEHAVTGLAHLDPQALVILHRQAHGDFRQIHGIADLRFRPGRALAVAMLQPEAPPAVIV